ncbi:MAG: DUF4279 domain-containing protein, partial [Pirellulales bacterium]|nr:DUF4279 domain-containing protein [Pirellulales bacterium]
AIKTSSPPFLNTQNFKSDGVTTFAKVNKMGKVQEHSPYRGGLWTMSSEHWVDSPCLETHLDWLLSQLDPLADKIRDLITTGITVDFFCFSEGATDTPPALPRSIRERADALGIPIEIDHYNTEQC